MPICFKIKSRRLNFLKYLLSEPSDSLVKQVLEAQMKHPIPNDCGQTFLKDLGEIESDTNMTKVMCKTKVWKWQNILNQITTTLN